MRSLTVAEATGRLSELLALEERASGPAGSSRAEIMARQGRLRHTTVDGVDHFGP